MLAAESRLQGLEKNCQAAASNIQHLRIDFADSDLDDGENGSNHRVEGSDR